MLDVPCPICESLDASAYRWYGEGKSGEAIVRCKAHKVWVAQRRPRLDGVASAPVWEQSEPERYAAILAAVSEFTPGERLHDFGCGNGHLAQMARDMGFHVGE